MFKRSVTTYANVRKRVNQKIYIGLGVEDLEFKGGFILWDVNVCVDSSVIGGGVSHRTKWLSGGGGVSLIMRLHAPHRHCIWFWFTV